MPVPKPNTNESRNDFISRCIEFLINEGTEQEQAIAICQTQWEDSKMIFCNALNKSFETKEQMFNELRQAKEQLIAAKKSQIYKSCEKGISITARPLSSKYFATKELSFDDNYYYIVVNTTKILDSHEDVHIDGIWNKTVKEQKGRNYLVADHKLEIDKTIVKKEYIEMFVANIPFSLLGKDYEGETEALIYKFPKNKIINQAAKEWLESGDAIEASVRMQYVDLEFAYDSNDPNDKKEKAAFDKYLPLIANKNDFEQIYYFTAVKQAKNIAESSLVIFGSNSVTGMINDNKIEPSKDTQTKEPLNNTLNYDKLINNLELW